ncbi:DNA primase [Bowmanella sp. JS7-9]|uniref:DNA primase n=1 Tax=Pseudobowmanella zhangzhouensis TaxID=1537679 RepID=A0ABW1XQ18_9ALTE|nr:DNA primase [Bowmanella sp. JS7-9]TBX20311.1 DNA primase [Bowmanella sp. JS7-9]
MAGRIPRDFIDDLIARSDIVDIVDSRVKLKKAGKNYQACCPFHNEKSPSFTVSQDKQFYHCFGCGAHGNVISFLIEYDRLEFPEAVEELARFHGVDVPREKGSAPPVSAEKRQQREDDYALMEKVAQFFAHQLKNHPDAARPIDYLKQRGLSGEVVKRFGVGFAPPEWDGALAAFGRSPELQQQLLDLKIITQNDKGRRFDFFRDRIMFPIRDRRGRVIGFGGRVINADDGPKYLNSPETRIFHKGHELYGLYQARQAHRALARVLIVEGYMDVVALAQFGIDYAVASLGTSTTPEHIQLLLRSTSQVVCCYDGDRAGRDAAWRALENALPYLKDGVELKFLFLPDGEDPDTLVRQIGKEAFEQKIDAESIPVSRFLFENLLGRHHVGSEEGKAALIAEAQALIDQVSGDNQRQLLEERLFKLTGQDSYRLDLQRDMAKANSATNKIQAPAKQKPAGKSQLTPVRIMLRLLLEQPELAAQCAEVQPQLLDVNLVPGLELLGEVHSYCAEHSQKNSAQVLEHFRSHRDFAVLNKLLSSDAFSVHDAIGELFAQSRQQVYRDSFAKLVERQLHSRMEELLARSRLGKLSDEEKQELKVLLSAQS